MIIDGDDVFSFKFVRHSAVARTSDHGGHTVALLYEVFFADWIIKTLSDGNVAEFGAMASRVIGHTESIDSGAQS
jgi:hypothetical protein